MRSGRHLIDCCVAVCALAARAANAQFPPVLDLLELTPEQGIVFLGESDSTAPGLQVSAGDLNDDGFREVIVSAPFEAYPMSLPGMVYVLFGGPTLLAQDLIDLATVGAPSGFVIEGPSASSFFGWSLVSGADFNADGIDDLAVGAPLAAPPGGLGNGQTFVIFGQPGIGAGGAFDLATLDGTNGFVINGRDWVGFLGDNGEGIPLGALDFNGDGYPDLAVAAHWASAPGRPNIGQAYVIFGGPDMGAGGLLDVADLDGSNGITINGRQAAAGMGPLVVPGDVNEDGLPDLLIGAAGYDPPGRPGAGAVFVIFGGTTPGPGGVIELLDVPGNCGYVIYGPEAGAGAGYPRAFGDVNGDGVDDIFIRAQSGVPRLVFGGADVGASGVVDLADLDGTNGFVIHAKVPIGDIDDDGFADFGRVIINGSPAGRRFAGISYVAYAYQGIGADGDFHMPEDLDGQNGFVIWGAHADDKTLLAGGLADINRDGVADFRLTSLSLQRPDGAVGGGVYVMFGRSRLALGDLDRDGDVDISDFFGFMLCYNGSSRPPADTCSEDVDADLDADGDVDLDDFAIFAGNYTGSL